MFTDEDVDVVAGRLRAWSEVLGAWAEPGACRSLLDALDTADRKSFHALIDPWELFVGVPCIEIAETVTKVAQTGDKEPVEVCEILPWLRPPSPSDTVGRGYRLADGTVLWLSEADWWELMDRAVSDSSWRDANHQLLVALGILRCHFELLSKVVRFDDTKTYQICPPTGDPHERRR